MQYFFLDIKKMKKQEAKLFDQVHITGNDGTMLELTFESVSWVLTTLRSSYHTRENVPQAFMGYRVNNIYGVTKYKHCTSLFK